ncbi:hypothetical protein LSTR_LSTR013851 [Laodelphax striatellus]|uniref:Uncharacterized protein n=1 Tax=Laodelphax striatellus TaxID=195883 RepID=A0A482WMI1_LAOST|nr:hypothetical protein LSTR_LSTR013851 [Laodelphax striatellus]
MSGVGFLAAVKTFTPRRRRSEKRRPDLSSTAPLPPDVVPSCLPPITPPPAFLPPGHRKALPQDKQNEQVGCWKVSSIACI